MVHDDAMSKPHGFDPFACFSGGLEAPAETAAAYGGLFEFDEPGLALEFGPAADALPEPDGSTPSWYDAPHPW